MHVALHIFHTVYVLLRIFAFDDSIDALDIVRFASQSADSPQILYSARYNEAG